MATKNYNPFKSLETVFTGGMDTIEKETLANPITDIGTLSDIVVKYVTDWLKAETGAEILPGSYQQLFSSLTLLRPMTIRI